jgi:hypothetical protein
MMFLHAYTAPLPGRCSFLILYTDTTETQVLGRRYTCYLYPTPLCCRLSSHVDEECPPRNDMALKRKRLEHALYFT